MTRGKRKNRKSTAPAIDTRPAGSAPARPEHTGDALQSKPKPWTGDKQVAAVEMLTRTGRRRPDPYTSVVVNEEVLQKAESGEIDDHGALHAYHLRQELLANQQLMEKIRSKGVNVTVAGEQLLRQAGTRAEQREAVARVMRGPKRYTASMSRPSGMLVVREMMRAAMGYEALLGAGVKPLHFEVEPKMEMYFATADFASLFAEMQRDFRDEQIKDYLTDILEEWGPSGQIVVGFDLNRQPIARVSKVFGDSTAWADLPPDPSVWSVEGDADDRMRVACLAFQWRTDDEGNTALFGCLRSNGDSVRTCSIGSPSIRDTVLMVWMLASRSLRMLESTVQPATAGLPPRAKTKNKRRALRDETVTVVALRRHVREQVEQVQQAESGRHLQHRFVVRGHWRNQSYGTDRALRRRTYILPYIKGPDGAPFIEREKVYQW